MSRADDYRLGTVTQHIKSERPAMAEQNHASAIEGVLGTFEGELRKLTERAENLQKQTIGAFADAHDTFTHAEHINKVVGDATSRLRRFLGPPPNTINMPKIDRDAEDAEVAG